MVSSSRVKSSVKSWVLSVLFCTLLPILPAGQDADIVVIADEDSSRSGKLYENLRKALREWEDQQRSVRDKYLVVPCVLDGTRPNPKAGMKTDAPGKNSCYLLGFENGFKYSRDFHSLVPDLKPTPGDVFNCWKVRP